MRTPLIGLTTYRSLNQQGYPQFSQSEAYTSALAQAGACPVMIPLGLPEAALQALLARLDGVLFTGGGDVDPERYGNPQHPLVAGVDSDRDQLEIDLAQQLARSGKPFLGICRGLQVINVALGGSLYEDLLEQHPNSLKHQFYPDWPRQHLAHAVQVEPGSRLAEILGASNAQVNSLHHQGIQRLAAGLSLTARAPDGVIEAFEMPGHPFGLAVQWHPENLQDHAPMRALFQAFVGAAGEV
ncbi:MAG: gamma-glutamyl-gamma-aminobutyrate hydrolase family protein [Chloroflexota bacterium]